MKKTYFLFLLLILCLRFSASGQNLVPNPSFENYTSCPDLGYISRIPPWFQPNIFQGNTTNSSTTDGYDTCQNASGGGIPLNYFGYQMANTGAGYAGIFAHGDTMNYREYMEVPLLSSLLANHHYCVSFYVSLADISYKAISNMGAYFSNDSLLISNMYNNAIDTVIPQVENTSGNMLTSKTTWTQVTGSFVANGGEKFMTIGNFHNPANTNAQSVSGGSIYPGGAYYYVDDVSVVDCLDEATSNLTNNQPSTIEISPNPATSEIKITTTNAVMKEAHIYTMMGQCIHQSTINNSQSTIDISSLPAGMYIAEVISEKGVIRKRFVKQ